MAIKTLGGFVCVRNGDRLDYCWREAVASLLPVCSEIVISDSNSNDGTTEVLHQMARDEPKIRVINWPWTDPKGESHHAFIRWLNFARSHLTTDCQITLDADEVLDDNPLCHRVILDALHTDNPCRFFHRLNFWRDARSLIPPHYCCAHHVARMGPASYFVHSDEPRTENGQDWRILDEAVFHPDLKIFHLGFLRRREAFYEKAKAVGSMWFASYDERIKAAEEAGKPVWESECEYSDKLIPYSGGYPASVRRWLEERGHVTT